MRKLNSPFGARFYSRYAQVKYCMLMLCYQPRASKQEGHKKTCCDLQLNIANLKRCSCHGCHGLTAAITLSKWWRPFSFVWCCCAPPVSCKGCGEHMIASLDHGEIHSRERKKHNMKRIKYEKVWWGDGWWTLQQSDLMNAMLQLVSYNMHQNDQSNALAHDANVCMAMQYVATRLVLCRYSDTCW